MSKFLNNKDRQNRAEFDKLLARCVRVVEAQPNLATLRLCESVCTSLTTLLESIRLTIEDRPRKNDLVMLRDRIQELSFERANETLNCPKYAVEDGVAIETEDDDETQIFGSPSNDAGFRIVDESGNTVNYERASGGIPMADIGTEAPDYPIDSLKDTLRTIVGRLREASTKGDVTPYTLASVAAVIDHAVSEFDKEVGS